MEPFLCIFYLANTYKNAALDTKEFRRISDGKYIDISQISDDDKCSLYYKVIPYDGKEVSQNLIITYSPKYAAYHRSVRAAQIARAEKMLKNGVMKKQRRNPNDPARFIGKTAVTQDGEPADISYYLDEEKIREEEKYDGLYAVCTDLLDDPVEDILHISEGRWEIEECFRIMKTEFEARPVYLSREERIKAHFLTCFISLTIYRLIERELKNKYTCEQILDTLRSMNFADIGEQGVFAKLKVYHPNQKACIMEITDVCERSTVCNCIQEAEF